MYDDLSLDYTYDHASNLDEDYASYTYAYDNLDEDDDHARDTQDFQELAYLHYAW